MHPIKKYSKESKRPLKDIAQGAGISEAYLCQIISGNREPTSIELYTRLSRETGIPIKELMPGFKEAMDLEAQHG